MTWASTPTDLIGKTVEEIVPGAEGRQLTERVQARAGAAEAGIRVSFERHGLRDGRDFWILVPIVEDGADGRRSRVAQDVDDLRTAERELSAETAPAHG